MLLAFVAFEKDGGHYVDLCVVPARGDGTLLPLRVGLLFASRAAVFWVGPEESLVIEESPKENAKILRPVPPAQLLLTPTASGQPGFKVAKAKVIDTGNGVYETLFTRDLINDDWQMWDPLTMNRM